MACSVVKTVQKVCFFEVLVGDILVFFHLLLYGCLCVPLSSKCPSSIPSTIQTWCVWKVFTALVPHFIKLHSYCKID